MLNQTAVEQLPVGTPVRTHNGTHRKNGELRGIIAEAQRTSVGYRYIVLVPKSEWDRTFSRPLDQGADYIRFYDDEVTPIGQAPADVTALFEQVADTGAVDWAALGVEDS